MKVPTYFGACLAALAAVLLGLVLATGNNWWLFAAIPAVLISVFYGDDA